MTTATAQPQTKLLIVREHMQAGRWPEAIRVAARFPDLGAQRNDILDAHTALTNPRWCAALGRCAAAEVEKGRKALIARYGI